VERWKPQSSEFAYDYAAYQAVTHPSTDCTQRCLTSVI
jgi:hypothetical protein